MKVINVGNKPIEFKLTADYLIGYRDAFKEDGLVAMQKMANMSESEQIEFSQKIAYLMSGADVDGITYRQWLRGFGFMDFFKAAPEILQEMMDEIAPLEGGEEEDESKNTEATEN